MVQKLLITLIDRAKGDPKNMVGIIIERTSEGLYKIGKKDGILLYSRNMIFPCKNKFTDVSEVKENSLSLRSTNAVQANAKKITCFVILSVIIAIVNFKISKI